MKGYLHFAFVLLAMTVSFFSFSALADVIPDSGTATGLVVDKNNKPLPGAKVEIVGQSASCYTDLDGRFNLKCEPGAKELLVTYPKCPDVKKRIKPDMTIRIGRTWRDDPEYYQWFVGATCGIGATSVFGDLHGTTVAPTISLMGGRAKDVGWYAKTFLTPRAYFSESQSSTSTFGGILGGMVRMGSPSYLCMGLGFASTDISHRIQSEGIYLSTHQYHKMNWQIDFGFLSKVSEHIAINCSFNVGINNDFNYVAGSYYNIGVCYFFNK